MRPLTALLRLWGLSRTSRFGWSPCRSAPIIVSCPDQIAVPGTVSQLEMRQGVRRGGAMISAVVHALLRLIPMAEVVCTNKRLALKLKHMCLSGTLNAEKLALYGNGITPADVVKSSNNSINVVGTPCHGKRDQRLRMHCACTTFI